MVDPVKEREYHILIIDEDENYVPIIRQGLSLWPKKNRLFFAQTTFAAHRIIRDDPPDIVFVAFKFIIDENNPFNLNTDTLLPYPVVIIIRPEEEDQATDHITSGEFDHLTRTDLMSGEIPQICDRCLRELRQITARLAIECRLAQKDEEIAGRMKNYGPSLKRYGMPILSFSRANPDSGSYLMRT